MDDVMLCPTFQGSLYVGTSLQSKAPPAMADFGMVGYSTAPCTQKTLSSLIEWQVGGPYSK